MTSEQKDKIGSPPSNDLRRRPNRIPGGSFLLGELVTHVLLKSLDDLKLQPFQDQFSMYTVVRFGDEVDFDRAEIAKALAAFLSGISQIEEPGHAGPAGVAGVTNTILNFDTRLPLLCWGWHRLCPTSRGLRYRNWAVSLPFAEQLKNTASLSSLATQANH